MQWKIKKESFVSEIMAFELVVVSSAYLPEYWSSAVNALTNSLKIPYETEGNFLQLNLPRIDEKRG